MSAPVLRRCLAELAGTGLLVGIGTGTIVGAGRVGGIPSWLMAVAWFAAVLVPIVLFVDVSGAHLNPAVTLGLAASGRIAWRELPAYWSSQLAGALLASVLVLLTLGGGRHLGATVPAGGDLVGPSPPRRRSPPSFWPWSSSSQTSVKGGDGGGCCFPPRRSGSPPS